MNNTDQINYSEAYDQLQRIVQEIEGGEISVDQLSEKVKLAAGLISICREKLQSTELEVEKILQELEKGEQLD